MKLSRDGLLTAILVVAALFVGSFVAERMPSPDRILSEQPFFHDVGLNEPARLRTAEVTVTGVQTAKRVELFGQVSESAGVWLVADLLWSPIGEPGTLGGSVVVVRAKDGREFGDLQPVSTSCGPTQPNLPVACQIAIEVSHDALDGAQLLIPAGGSARASDDVAVVDLGIDAEEALRLAAADSQISLLETRSVPR